MRLGPYAVTLESVPSMALNAFDSLRVRLAGIPRMPGDTPAEIATQTLKSNARKVLWAGAGHFRFMWVSDFAKALRGAERVLAPSYLRAQIAYMIHESARRGRATSCFSSWRGFDMPYYRADSLPWLVYSVAEYCRWLGEARLADEHRPALQRLIDSYMETHFKDGLLDPALTGDWMDTILRPSSTYSNLCVLRMLEDCAFLGLRARREPEDFARTLLERRWRGTHFTDYHATERPGVDAAVLALYLGLFDAPLRRRLAELLEASPLVRPLPIRTAVRDYERELLAPISRLTPRYHSSIWLHLGLMYLNGARRAGLDVAAHKTRLDGLIMIHRQMLEVLDAEGRPYQTALHSTEYGLSMCAGQYLELALG